MSSQIPQRKLESSIVAIDDDLQRDQGILINRTRCMRLIWASHGRQSSSVSCLTCRSSSVMDPKGSKLQAPKLLRSTVEVVVALKSRMWKGDGCGNEVTRFKSSDLSPAAAILG